LPSTIILEEDLEAYEGRRGRMDLYVWGEKKGVRKEGEMATSRDVGNTGSAAAVQGAPWKGNL